MFKSLHLKLFNYSQSGRFILNRPDYSATLSRIILRNNTRTPPRFYTDEQMKDILTKTRPFVRDFVKVLLHTGFRSGELQRLKWDYVDFKNRIVIVELSKSHKFRAVPINDTLYNHLLYLKRKAKRGQIYVFEGDNSGEPFSDFYHAFTREMKRIGMKGTVHMLRHTFASKLVQLDVNTYAVKELLGHASVQTTQVYAHIRMEDLSRAVSVLN